MTTGLMPFDFEGQTIRTLGTPDEPLFVASDVATVLGYSATAAMTRRLDDEDKGVRDLHTPGGVQQMSVITEAGLYAAILGSQIPQAKDFKRWVTRVVLPQIRKTGSYSQPAAVPAVMPTHSEALRGWAREIDAREAAEERVRELEPKAEYVDQFVSTDDMTKVRDAANKVGMSDHQLRELLVEKRWIYKQLIGRRWSKSHGKLVDEFEWRPYANHSAHFRLMGQHNAPRHHNNQLRQTLYITPEGLTAVQQLIASVAVAS